MDFRPLDPSHLPWWRRAALLGRRPVNRLLRWVWLRSGPSRSTWFDSRRWRVVWNVNRWFSATPRQHRHLEVVRFGPSIRMELDLSRLTDVLAYCYGAGEIEVAHACARLCPPDAVIADVGGNIGTTTLAFAAAAPRGHVHVFEPAAAMQACLRRNLALSGATHVTVHPYGLSDLPARRRLHVAIAGNPGSAYVVDGDDDDPSVPDTAAAIELRRLDDVLAGQRLDFVKIDVEGYELRVLRGASELLRVQRPAVLFEVNEAALRRAGTSGREICAHMIAAGYRLHYLDRGRFRDYDPETMLARKLHNVIAIHPTRAIPGPA